MDKIYINSQFINNLNDILDRNYFEVIILKSNLEHIIYEIILNCDNQSIMRIKVNTQQVEIRQNSQLESEIINNLMNELEKMMLKDLMFGKISYAVDVNGQLIKTLRSCIFELENNNN